MLLRLKHPVSVSETGALRAQVALLRGANDVGAKQTHQNPHLLKERRRLHVWSDLPEVAACRLSLPELQLEYDHYFQDSQGSPQAELVLTGIHLSRRPKKAPKTQEAGEIYGVYACAENITEHYSSIRRAMDNSLMTGFGYDMTVIDHINSPARQLYAQLFLGELVVPSHVGPGRTVNAIEDYYQNGSRIHVDINPQA